MPVLESEPPATVVSPDAAPTIPEQGNPLNAYNAYAVAKSYCAATSQRLSEYVYKGTGYDSPQSALTACDEHLALLRNCKELPILIMVANVFRGTIEKMVLSESAN